MTREDKFDLSKHNQKIIELMFRDKRVKAGKKNCIAIAKYKNRMMLCSTIYGQLFKLAIRCATSSLRGGLEG